MGIPSDLGVADRDDSKMTTFDIDETVCKYNSLQSN